VPPRTWLAEPDEAGAVARLLVEFRDWYGVAWPPEESFRSSIERLLAEPTTEFLLGAPSEDASPAGVCQLRFRHSVWTAAEDCWLEDLFVRESARGLGVGRALAEAAIERARERGSRRIELDVNDANPAALALYEHLGFSAWVERAGGRNLLMRLRL
jgi:GNAT superfamily N-acetyltransferase